MGFEKSLILGKTPEDSDLGRDHEELWSSRAPSTSSDVTKNNSPEFQSHDVMDPAVWSRFPCDMLDHVRSCLPVDSLVRFRAVCKGWDTCRLRMCAGRASPCERPWVFFIPKYDLSEIITGDKKLKYLSMYDTGLKKWHKLPLCPPLSFPRCSATTAGGLLAVDGGLLCYFAASETGSVNVVVSNPVTKSWHRLPSMLETGRRVSMLAMVVNTVAKTYKVVVAGGLWSESERGLIFGNSAEIYDSQTGSWIKTGNIPVSQAYQDPSWLGRVKGKPIFSQGFLYVWDTTCLTHPGEFGNTVLALDLDQRVWSTLPIPFPSVETKVLQRELLEWRDRILMTAKLQSGWKVESICIWELQRGNLKWKEVDRLPQGIFTVFVGDDGKERYNPGCNAMLDTCQVGQFVYFFTYNLHDPWRRCKLLEYDLSKNTWKKKLQNISVNLSSGRHKISKNTWKKKLQNISVNVCGGRHKISAFIFEPSLDPVLT